MSRIKIELPPQLPFSTRMAVHIGDINYGNHLANDAVLRLCHEARLRFLAHLGCRETDVGGCGLIMADAAIQFQGQAFHGDELTIDVGAADVVRSGFALYYRIRRESDQAAIARVKTGMVFFDYAAQKVAATPEAFVQALADAGCLK
ncbi:acyl-CoA thioesterase FadM [Neisseria sp. HSC-16F19]|nr:thioesterase family protein [Neisseria sp. HSC-16F19]MCP2040954.1 acyl-CoA thioesterase FadM [Neisseria sp. HSC-16F19]